MYTSKRMIVNLNVDNGRGSVMIWAWIPVAHEADIGDFRRRLRLTLGTGGCHRSML